MTRPEALLVELSVPGRGTDYLPRLDVPQAPLPDAPRGRLGLPEVSEVDVVRHFTRLSQLNYSIDTGIYPLGSCTMKYNPRVNEAVARLPGFLDIHPLQDEATVQGALELLWELQEALCAIAGMDACSVQPAAGAQGEFTGVQMIRAYHRDRRDPGRDTILVPDSAHGTNPATAAMVGYAVEAIASDERGNIGLDALKAATGDRVAGLMVTNPNTLGLFEEHIAEVAAIIHAGGGLVYADGANMNALLGVAKARELGMDILHYNLHKTFATPHGGGGPGAGATAVVEAVAPFLPRPVVVRRDDGSFGLDADRPRSIGRVHGFHGNFSNCVRGLAYILANGADGLAAVSRAAVLNANYLRVRLGERYDSPFDRFSMHEAILSGRRQAKGGVHTLDIAKRLEDYGCHPPTIYFPLTVPEAMLIEPTETESVASLDAFVAAMMAIADEAETDPDLVTSAPHTTPVRRLDEATAARKPRLTWSDTAG
ncbi:MAG: aminomethyl-transferring glycine dehydrogenase subunit GcvPB [Anaerolineae bacterium]